MSLIEWRNEFEIGITSVDHEHRGLIGLINELHDKLAGNANKETIAKFLGEIHALISAHFALEEKEMRDLGYDELDGHKEEHEDLLDQIRDMMEELEDDRIGRTEEDLGRRLNEWFTVHFRTRDARLHRYLATLKR